MIFLDTSFVVALEVSTDAHHETARKALDRILLRSRIPVISDYIFDESVTVLLAKTRNIATAAKTGAGLLKSCTIRQVDESIFSSAWELFRAQKTTAFSFTDCTTIALMRRERIQQLATFDADFENIEGITIVQ